MADETTDVSKQEQMSLCICYNWSWFEISFNSGRFFKVWVVSDLSDQDLATTIIENLQSAGIN